MELNQQKFHKPVPDYVCKEVVKHFHSVKYNHMYQELSHYSYC